MKKRLVNKCILPPPSRNLTSIADPADPDPDELLSQTIIADLFLANCVDTANALRDFDRSRSPTAKWARLTIYAIESRRK